MFVTFLAVSVLAIFGYFLSFLERQAIFPKFWTKFQIKLLKCFQSRFTSLLLHSKSVQRNWVQFLKNL